MGRIKVLPDQIANKIAAGEVVERPASVVKELIENSLDAGAGRIRVEVQNGGKRLIRISDDGIGMGNDDALLAFERHATSKLREVHDLLSISTLGFRGEALPSIASVSRLELETRSADDATGTKIEIAGGRMLTVAEDARPPGTTITVRDLFYNVPARRKFLRTEKTELAHIASLVTHYSLAHIDKTILLAHEKGPLLNVTPVESLRERVYQVFGSSTLDDLVELGPCQRELQVQPSPAPRTQAVSRHKEGRDQPRQQLFRLHGFISQPQIQKLNRNSIYVFVNGRLIRDRVVLRAISSAYHNVIPPGAFPFVLLFIGLPFDEVDVNVHPSKTEVRFGHPSFVFDFVRDQIRECLIASKPVSTFPIRAEGSRVAYPQSATDLSFSEASLALNRSDLPESMESFLRHEAPPTQRMDFGAAPPLDVSGAQPSAPAFGVVPDRAGLHILGSPDTPIEQQTHARDPLVDTPRESMAQLGQLRPLGQMHDSFIIASGHDGLWIIDQHVAHERILFEKVRRERAQGRTESQRLLLSIIITLRPDQEITLTRIEEEFRANGFELEPFGHRTIAVKAASAGLSPRQVETLIGEILDTPEKELRELSLSDLQDRVAATIACHAAIKVNMPLEPAKMQWLLDELARTECPMSCPHGRPIALKYALKDILKAFHRI
ncbi:MAG: DNA mismatch repair endonuclease MutL [Acidobacteria bacterium]|nr:DNA mismatch repair endonuclease MutL [Acidobacteriota bacterium]